MPLIGERHSFTQRSYPAGLPKDEDKEEEEEEEEEEVGLPPLTD